MLSKSEEEDVAVPTLPLLLRRGPCRDDGVPPVPRKDPPRDNPPRRLTPTPDPGRSAGADETTVGNMSKFTVRSVSARTSGGGGARASVAGPEALLTMSPPWPAAATGAAVETAGNRTRLPEDCDPRSGV